MIDLLTPYRTRLLECRDFLAFDDLAQLLIQAEPDPQEGAAAIERLLEDLVAELAATDKAEAARAIDEYVARVWPARRRRRLGTDGTAQIASKYEVRDLLAAKTAHELAEAGSPTEPAEQAAVAAPGQPDDTAGPPTPPGAEPKVEPQKGSAGENSASAQSGDFARLAGRSYDELCVVLTRNSEANLLRRLAAWLTFKSSGPVYRVLIVGMATAGKTFFLRRLEKTMRGGYTLVTEIGFAGTEDPETGRTTGFSHYRLFPSKARKPSFDIFDVPGEAFRELNSNDVAIMAEESRRSFHALLAAADMLVVVEPALMTLALSLYGTNGDDFDRAAVAKATAAGGDATALQATLQLERRKKIATHEAFVTALAVLAKRMEMLRSIKVKPAQRTKLEALKRRVELFESNFAFGAMQGLKRPLPVPALLLLSRADEYERSGQPPPDYDRDPASTLLAIDPDRYLKFASLFDTFAVDFITSSEMETPKTDFDQRTPYGGFRRLFEDWVIPAIKDSRRRGWRKAMLWRRRLRQHAAALMLRRWLDPDFRRFYDEAAR